MGCALCGSGAAAAAAAAGDPASAEEQRSPLTEGGALDAAHGRQSEGEADDEEAGAEPFLLAGAQKGLIRDSWKILHQDIARVGIIVFIRLFETHPECKDAFFLFRDFDDLQQLKVSKELQAHGLRVMSFIEKSVARLDQEQKLQQLALELGRSHFRYKAAPKYYEYIGTQFIRAAQPILKEAWTPEVETAWQGLFHYLVGTMRHGFYAEERTARADPSLR